MKVFHFIDFLIRYCYYVAEKSNLFTKISNITINLVLYDIDAITCFEKLL